MRERLVLGVDAGGTSVRVRMSALREETSPTETLAVAASADGSPPDTLPWPSAPIVSVCAGLAKFTRTGVREAWERRLSEVYPDVPVIVVPDYKIAFHAAVPGSSGIVVIAGTGSVAYGEHRENGARIRVGGRGYEWGDEGSGTWLTTEMVRRTLRALDGMADSTPLTDTVCEFFETEEPGTLAALARDRATGGDGRGFLLPLLVRRLHAQDREARDLFIGAGGWLAALAWTTARRLGFPADGEVTVALAGGVFTAGGDVLRTAFVQALERRYPNARVVLSEADPVVGAVRLATSEYLKRTEIWDV